MAPLICDKIGAPRINVTAANEHVTPVERRIKVVKERCRATRHSLPFPRITSYMTISMVLFNGRMLNNFPSKGGVSDRFSPRMLLTGENLDAKRDLPLEFCSYCQVHENDEPRNTMVARTQAALSMGPSGNKQGGQNFMSLRTGLKLVRFSWDELPMPDTVVGRVRQLAKGQPDLMSFLDRKRRLIGNEVELPGVDGVDPQDPQDEVEAVESDELDSINEIVAEARASVPGSADSDGIGVELPPPEQVLPSVEPMVVPEPTTAPVAPLDNQPSGQPVEIPGVRRSSRVKFAPSRLVPSLKGNRYSYAVTQLQEGILHPDLHMQFLQHMCDEAPDVVAAILTQLSMKAGLREWGKDAEKAVFDEMKQLHVRRTFVPKHWHQLKKEQRARVLEAHLFLKQKTDGTIKGRAVAGGNKQRDYISKEDSSSPTVATESVLLTAVIAAEERRDTVVVDIPNAFIQTRVEREEDKVIIRVRGYLVDVLCKIDPNYKKFVTTNKKGEKQLLLLCENAIYGTLIASLLFYNKFVKTLTRNGFELNPYDACLANRMVDGKQQTCGFHVDDCFLTGQTATNDAFVETLREEYESVFEDGSGKLKVQRGKVLEYLGMTLDFTTAGQVKVSMFNFVDDLLRDYRKAAPEEHGIKTSAAPRNLFVVDDDCEKLDKKKAEQFHHLVAKTLFATKRARPDTGTAVSFLSTRVRAPDKQDWTKLVHMMKYLRGTR